MKGEQNTTRKELRETWRRSIQSELLAENDTWRMTGKLSLKITVAVVTETQMWGLLKKKKKMLTNACLPIESIKKTAVQIQM